MYPTQNYQRAAQMMPQQVMSVPNGMVAPQFLKGRPVSSFDEVKAITVDFDGSIYYFPDTANKLIYTKQINFDGTPIYGYYEFKQLPVPSSSGDYITREEFNETLNQLKSLLVQPKEKKEDTQPSANFTFQ